MNKYEIVSDISRITTTYLAKLGVLCTFSFEDDSFRFERIDEPEQIALDMELCFVPIKLGSDEEALNKVYNIEDIITYDITLSYEIGEIIIRDCQKLLTLI